MKIFLSYSSDNVDLAARMAHSLKDEGDDVFWDRESLPVGEAYDRRIREAIQDSDVFVFLLDSAAVSLGSYALAELSIAERASVDSEMKVLPVMVSAIDFDSLPPFLRSITVLQPRGDILAETLAAVADLRQEIKRQQVSVSVMVTNSGWLLNLQILDFHPREIFYRLGDHPDFRSTGLGQNTDLKTGRLAPRLYVTVPAFTGTQELFIKYVDSRGHERGPFRMQIDAVQALVASAKDVLETTRPWVEFNSPSDGTSACVYFTHLVGYKYALREIRYSIDNDSLSNSLRFTPPSRPGDLTIGQDDETLVDIPPTTRFVCVKLYFIDGTEWPAERFDR
jgi:hypothetical protein